MNECVNGAMSIDIECATNYYFNLCFIHIDSISLRHLGYYYCKDSVIFFNHIYVYGHGKKSLTL